jgi:hypothetical protein
MGKLPSFQFYSGDWLKYPHLRMAIMSSKGIWIDLLCATFEAKERGAIKAAPDQFCKLLGCTRDEFDLFLRNRFRPNAKRKSPRRLAATRAH